MRKCRREISKEEYEIAMDNNGFLTEEQDEIKLIDEQPTVVEGEEVWLDK